MTIDKAIEILSDDRFGTVWPTPKSEIDAIKLGIEALRHISDFRLTVDGKPTYLLPGETKD